jgi:hypothetical protein
LAGRTRISSSGRCTPSPDREYSSLGWEAVARYAEELRIVEAALQAARDALHIWSHYFNGIAVAGDPLDRQLAGKP